MPSGTSAVGPTDRQVAAGIPAGSSRSLTTARALILLQLLSRLLTFGLNQALVRLAPPEVFGTAAIQFDLVCSTILFLSREGVRNALLRGESADGNNAAAAHRVGHDGARKEKQGGVVSSVGQSTRLAALPLHLAIPISLVTLVIYLARLPSSTSGQPDFYPSLALYVLSALLELAIEPLYIKALRSDPPRIRVRVQAEGGMAIARAVVTVGSMILFGWLGSGRPGTGERALLAFALGQMAGAIWLAGRYIWDFGMPVLSLKRASKGEARFHPAQLSLTVANVKQSFIKHFLTEADRIAVGAIYPLKNQGGYAVAMNYGSLVARIIFQPIEETLFLHFSSPASSLSSDSALLLTALRISLHLPLLLFTFLPPLLPSILPILLPGRYLQTSTPAILQTYLQFYIPLLSLNGLLEAFHTATATPVEVARQVRWMVAGSAAFAGALWVFRKVEYRGEEGLVYASCAAMGVRILYAYLHARRVVGNGREGAKAVEKSNGLGLWRLTPGWATPVVLGLSGGVLRAMRNRGVDRGEWKGRLIMILAGGVLGLASVGVIGLGEYWRWKAIRT